MISCIGLTKWDQGKQFSQNEYCNDSQGYTSNLQALLRWVGVIVQFSPVCDGRNTANSGHATAPTGRHPLVATSFMGTVALLAAGAAGRIIHWRLQHCSRFWCFENIHRASRRHPFCPWSISILRRHPWWGVTRFVGTKKLMNHSPVNHPRTKIERIPPTQIDKIRGSRIVSGNHIRWWDRIPVFYGTGRWKSLERSTLGVVLLFGSRLEVWDIKPLLKQQKWDFKWVRGPHSHPFWWPWWEI